MSGARRDRPTNTTTSGVDAGHTAPLLSAVCFERCAVVRAVYLLLLWWSERRDPLGNACGSCVSSSRRPRHSLVDNADAPPRGKEAPSSLRLTSRGRRRRRHVARIRFLQSLGRGSDVFGSSDEHRHLSSLRRVKTACAVRVVCFLVVPDIIDTRASALTALPSGYAIRCERCCSGCWWRRLWRSGVQPTPAPEVWERATAALPMAGTATASWHPSARRCPTSRQPSGGALCAATGGRWPSCAAAPSHRRRPTRRRSYPAGPARVELQSLPSQVSPYLPTTRPRCQQVAAYPL
ncbi:hypothetical protein V5799_005819 [Amblyomma americanum]|uniref:Uncharacterized protein n=1 Tax=Amblyomma americanum TaxID=6943 RepID=A0AAQ4DY58_AMBAM